VTEMSFEEFWLSTLKPGTPPELIEHWRRYVMSGVQRGADIIRVLAPYLDLSRAVALDLGCGYGGTCIALAKAGATVTGVDLETVYLQGASIWAGEHAVPCGVSFEQASAEYLPFADASFDLVVCADLIEHVDHQGSVVREISRVLRPGGLALVSFPNLLSPRNLLSDPHYQMFGVSVLPRSLGSWYVTHFRKRSLTYAVGRFPIASALKRAFGRRHLAVIWQNPRLRRSLGPLTPLVRLLRDNTYPKVEWVMCKS
jgi:2-polyprenyl-3-methyl-5-hydroxy-6-metoxy-1,4-benzoquinol methylase